MEHGADINKQTDDGETPLYKECKNGHYNVVKYLVEIGADINKRRNNGGTLLFFACGNGCIQ